MNRSLRSTKFGIILDHKDRVVIGDMSACPNKFNPLCIYISTDVKKSFIEFTFGLQPLTTGASVRRDSEGKYVFCSLASASP